MTNFIQNFDFVKFESTPHIEGSRLQLGDNPRNQVRYSKIAGRFIVVEEKLDGGQSGIRYSPYGEQLRQSRGHYLVGGGRERQFNLFKSWAAAHEDVLLNCLEDRYIAFGEWMHKKHAIFYDALPHYWNEFDIWDCSAKRFLDTVTRRQILLSAPVLQVPVLFAGVAPPRMGDLLAEIRMSYAKTNAWRDTFEKLVKKLGFNLDLAWQMADKSDLMEGLYIKVEENGFVTERYKYVRHDFVQSILDSDEHHSQQPYIPNQLAAGVDIFAPVLTKTWADLGVFTKGAF
jgi:hypothetical protein